MEFRDYQTEIIKKGTDILRTSNFVYLAMEVRTGKTLTSLGICDNMGVENVLFLTKKKAMLSISRDYDLICPASFVMFVCIPLSTMFLGCVLSGCFMDLGSLSLQNTMYS